MEHWFDALVKRAARGRPSRRDALAAGFGLGAAAATTSLLGPGVIKRAFAQPVTGNGCFRRHVGTATMHDLRVSADGLRLQQQTSFDPRTHSGTSSITITRGATVIVKMDVRTAGGAITANFSYGPEVGGIRSATVNSPNGHDFRGTIDGRPFTSGRIHSLREARFTDRRPVPEPHPGANLLSTIGKLFQQSRAVSRTCRSATMTPALPQPSRTHPLRRPRTRPSTRGSFHSSPRDANAAGNAYVPGSHESPTCDHCLGDTCNDEYGKCLYDNIVDIFCPPCAAGAVAICLAEYGVCQAGCYAPGKGCCPVLCGTPFIDNCCGDGATCISGHKLCCPPGQAVCNGVCCDRGVSSCGPDGRCGCPGNGIPCGDQCCDAGEACCGTQCCGRGKICCGGACCAANECHNNTCCYAPSHMCGSVCCPPFNPCCNGKCCPGGACVNGQCCPQAQLCGRACCAPGQTCVNPNASQCGAQRKCHAGTRPCRSQTSDGQMITLCCPRGVTCCAGKCCPRGMQCCAIGGGQAVCALPYQCVH
jgi:hypothetical protein